MAEHLQSAEAGFIQSKRMQSVQQNLGQQLHNCDSNPDRIAQMRSLGRVRAKHIT